MHRKLATQILLSLSVASLLMLTNTHLQAQGNDQKFSISVSPGYFQEDFRWSIAGTSQGKDPNIYSELRWQKLSGPQISGSAQYNFWKGFVLRTNFHSAFITKGNITDTDFGEDNRKDTLYHDSFDSNKGNILSGDLTAGYQIKFTENFSATPFIGYGISDQSLYILRDFGSVTGNLKSTYQTQWNGLTIGRELRIKIKRIIIQQQLIYHQVNYSAKANWNLIEDFQHPVSFRHKAKGYGLETGINIHYRFNKIISVFADGKYSYWTTGKGTDTLYRNNGDISITQMNGAVRNNFNIALGIAFSF
jgi:outer membrane protease